MPRGCVTQTMRRFYRVDGNVLRLAAHYGSVPVAESVRATALAADSLTGRAILDRKTIHIHDLAAKCETEFPEARDLQTRGTRTVLAMPLLREGVPIGAISFAARKSVPSQTNRSICLKPSLTRR